MPKPATPARKKSTASIAERFSAFFNSHRTTAAALLWTIFALILTFGNTGTDIRQSSASAIMLTLGMAGLSFINLRLMIRLILSRFGLLPYIVLSVVLLFGSVAAFTALDLQIEQSFAELYRSKNEPDTNMLDINLPNESQDFFSREGTENKAKDVEPLLLTAQTKITVLFVCAYFLSFIQYYILKQQHEEEEKKRLEKEKSEMELRFLRSQINPHFLFNALNNIYSMVYIGDKNAPDSILMLSEMLRYVTDESKQSTIRLEDEVNYIKNYVDFQRFRFEKDADIGLSIDIATEDSSLPIPTMVMQPFVENCFKHSGMNTNKKAFIHISLTCHNGHFAFLLDNSISSTPYKGHSKRKGIGITNVRERLEMLMPDNFSLATNSQEGIYSVELQLDLTNATAWKQA